MSFVGALPQNICRPSEFSSGAFCAPGHTHHRQPSHRRTPSQIIFDDSFLCQVPPSAPQDRFPVSLASSAQLSSRPLARDSEPELRSGSAAPAALTKSEPSGSSASVGKSSKPKSKAKGLKVSGTRKPDLEELFATAWGCGATSSAPSPKCSGSGLSVSSRRSSGSDAGGGSRLFGFLGRRRSEAVKTDDLAGLAQECGGKPAEDEDEFQFQLFHQDKEDAEDCVSECDTVVEFDVESDAESCVAEDPNMLRDLYFDHRELTGLEDSFSNDSIDEQEFPLGPIQESTLESQKSGLLCEDCFSDDSSMEIHQKQSRHSRSKSSIQEHTVHKLSQESLDQKENYHSHYPSGGSSHPESDIPLREIVTGRILQGLHDEIIKQEQEPFELPGSLSLENGNVSDQNVCQTIEYADMVEPSPSCKQKEGEEENQEDMAWWGMKWSRIEADSEFIGKVHSGLESAGKLIAKHWRYLPLVALPILVMVVASS